MTNKMKWLILVMTIIAVATMYTSIQQKRQLSNLSSEIDKYSILYKKYHEISIQFTQEIVKKDSSFLIPLSDSLKFYTKTMEMSSDLFSKYSLLSARIDSPIDKYKITIIGSSGNDGQLVYRIVSSTDSLKSELKRKIGILNSNIIYTYSDTSAVGLDWDNAKKVFLSSCLDNQELHTNYLILKNLNEKAFKVESGTAALTIVSVIILFFATLWAVRWSDYRFMRKSSEHYKGLSVVGIIVKRKRRSLYIALSIAVIALVSYSAFTTFLGLTIIPLVVAAFFILMLIILGYDKVLEYRISRGFFGSNEKEVREILSFIIDESSENDISSGGKTRKIFNEVDIKELELSVKELVLTTPAFAERL